MIAALFVSATGPYIGLPGVDAWPETRDARLYAGPHPVVAHPPCERWGRYWGGGPSARVPRKLGDDGGCFESALGSVRKWGGVLEHPADTHAWKKFGLMAPPKDGGWVSAGDWLGWVCHVEQGHYGHRARKATWLYAVSAELPLLKWGPSTGVRIDEGFHTQDERARARARCRSQANQETEQTRVDLHAPRVPRHTLSYRRARAIGMTPCEFLSARQRKMTPVPFRDLLLSIAHGFLHDKGDTRR